MAKEKEILYQKEDLMVVWKPHVCIHSANCVKGLPRVFRPNERPWIQPESATVDQLKATIDTCPSGALSYFQGERQLPDEVVGGNGAELEVLADGPYKVKCTIQVQLPDGSTEVKEKATFLCRCGASSNKPYCDGTHRKIDFRG
jgi:uncharacterized Fe-S cluster protein YjdI